MSFDKYSDKAAEAIALIREFAKVEYWDFFKGDPEQALEAFCAMQDAAEEMGRMNNHRAWISVDERLPPAMRERMFSENVLVINMKSNYPNVQISELNYFENENVWRGCNVTHWMPLPKVPGAAPSQPQQEAVPAESSELVRILHAKLKMLADTVVLASEDIAKDRRQIAHALLQKALDQVGDIGECK